jgi:hypothetical protein
METMTETGTEKRVDELSRRVDFGFEQANRRIGRVEDDLRELRSDMKAGFEKVDGEFIAVRSEMKAGFDKVTDEFVAVRGEMKAGFDVMQRQMTRFFAGTLASIVAGIVVTLLMSHS